MADGNDSGIDQQGPAPGHDGGDSGELGGNDGSDGDRGAPESATIERKANLSRWQPYVARGIETSAR